VALSDGSNDGTVGGDILNPLFEVENGQNTISAIGIVNVIPSKVLELC
jgi:hypothetical protein